MFKTPLKRAKGIKPRATSKRRVLGHRSAPHAKLEAYIKAIPEGSHGSGSLQKRLWKITSDFCRLRDWEKYGRITVTGEVLNDWRDGDAGHYISFSKCNGLYKFHPQNIHLQGKASNGWGGQNVGHLFGETLKRRYGKNILQTIEQTNNSYPLKFTTQDVRDLIKTRIYDLSLLKEQPDYYRRVVELLK